jgi:hypothetical protein
MSYLLCSMGLLVLILVMPYFYSLEVNEVVARTAEAELKEITEYTSNTLANLYYLANSTVDESFSLTKQLVYLPLTVQDSFYTLGITIDDDASKVTATLRDKPTITASSWLVPGLKVASDSKVEVDTKSVVAGCRWNGTDYLVWLGVSG